MIEITVPDGWYVLYCDICGFTISWTDAEVESYGQDFYGLYIFASQGIVQHLHEPIESEKGYVQESKELSESDRRLFRKHRFSEDALQGEQERLCRYGTWCTSGCARGLDAPVPSCYSK